MMLRGSRPGSSPADKRPARGHTSYQPAGGQALDPEAPVQDLTAAVGEALEARRWRYTAAMFGGDGRPAILAVRGSRLLALVLVANAGKVSAAEHAWLGSIRRVPGCQGEVVTPASFATLPRLLDRGANQRTIE
jgi:hypothetical protein